MTLALACPRCRSAPLAAAGAEELRCGACGAAWPVVLGIPDLRTTGDPYLTREEDVAAATQLAERAGRLSFAELLASYYAGNAKVSAAQAARFTHGVIAAGARARSVLAQWRSLDGARPLAGELALDLGAGTGPLAIALAREGAHAVAVDAGLRWLVLARRRCEEAGVRVTLVCANAERLPFGDAVAGVVAGESVIENVAGQGEAFAEAHRVLAPGGSLWLSTPNRRSLGPDPHLGVMAGGWMSGERIARIARARGEVPPRRRLLDARELREALTRADLRVGRIAAPALAPEQRASLRGPLAVAAAGYELARRLPIARAALTAVGPTLLVVARR